jgi:hypothetical protein
MTPNYCRAVGCDGSCRGGSSTPRARSGFAPFVVKHWRRCSSCGRRAETICLNGADAPVREPYYRCGSCRAAPTKTDRFLELLERDAQLPLAATSDRTETLPRTETKRAGLVTGSLSRPLARTGGAYRGRRTTSRGR